jgi:hypothetical protein
LFISLFREGESIRILDEKEFKEQKRWDALPLKEKIAEWAIRRQYSIIVGSWAVSLGIAGVIISRNKLVKSYEPDFIEVADTLCLNFAGTKLTPKK